MIFWNRPPPPQTITRVKRVKCFVHHKVAFKRCDARRIFCAYLHGMYDFTRFIRAIVCGEIDLCSEICKKFDIY